jgi:competence protein ComGC
MNLPIQSKEKGFTFFEVIFITVILSLGLLTIIKIFPLGFKAKETAEQYSIAALLGQKIIEEAKREGYESLSDLFLSQGEDGGIKEGEFENYQGYRYRLEWRDSETPYLRELKVTILLNNSKIKSKEMDGNIGNHLNNEDNYWQCLDLVTYLAKKD